MPCSHCGKDSKIVGRGLCRTCYTRWHRTGTLEYKRKGKPPSVCSEEGCYNLHVAKGYCEKHYRMLVRRGTSISPFGYGERRKHPLYERWHSITRTAQGIEKEWNDFWVFVDDVEQVKLEDTDEKCVLSRIDIKKPWGKDNFYWKKVLPATEDSKEYQRRWRLLNPERAKSYGLKKTLGIDISEYAKMYDKQSGKCYLCGKPGTFLSEQKNCRKTLAVDHCHNSGKIRKLLCGDCNHGLGNFKDNPLVLRKAAAYIVQHAKEFSEEMTEDVTKELRLFD